MTQSSYEGWAILELMGHRQRVGRVSEEEVYGGKMLRIDIPLADLGGEVVTEFYGCSSVYSLRPISEDRADAAQNELEHMRWVERMDAARYRWLRSRELDTIDAGGIFIGRVPENTVINGEDADRAIDAAISPRTKDEAHD